MLLVPKPAAADSGGSVPKKRRTAESACAADVAAVVAGKVAKVQASASCVNAELQNELAMCDSVIHDRWPHLIDTAAHRRCGHQLFNAAECNKALRKGEDYACTGLKFSSRPT